MRLPKPDPLILAVLASLFFATTFVLNRIMALNDGGWIWSSSLRFYRMLPFFVLIVIVRKNFAAVVGEIGQRPFQWLLRSTVGFWLFYAPLSFAAAYSQSWLVASTWQFTTVAGSLIAPFVRASRKGRGQSRLSSLLYSGHGKKVQA